MSREESAHDAVQALIPDDTIIDVALTYPCVSLTNRRRSASATSG